LRGNASLIGGKQRYSAEYNSKIFAILQIVLEPRFGIYICMQWRNSYVDAEPGGDPEDAKPSVYYWPNVDLATIVAIVAIVASPRSWSRSAEMAIY
jgi:hypothetical protein